MPERDPAVLVSPAALYLKVRDKLPPAETPPTAMPFENTAPPLPQLTSLIDAAGAVPAVAYRLEDVITEPAGMDEKLKVTVADAVEGATLM